ncbi:MAG: HEAT repeat domain-containing protein [Bryobacterales bacterium]|nr:HEAT repeat domain-containing protein [Bryobacterales bacterium]
MLRASILLVCGAASLFAQATAKDIRQIARGGSSAIPQLQEYLRDPSFEVRVEVVKALTDIGTQHSLEPLILATRDNDAEVQVRATDGLVNFYLPGYVRTGFGARVRRIGGQIQGRFTDTNDQVIPPHVEVRQEVVDAIGKLAGGGASMTSRANAARAIGILRGRAALPDLVESLKSKNSDVIYEALIAFQKIGDKSMGPEIAYLLRDFDQRVQLAAIETTGLLQNHEAVPQLLEVFRRSGDKRVRKAALTSMAMMPREEDRSLFLSHLQDRDEGLRQAAAEGIGRLRNPDDTAKLEAAFASERSGSARLSQAFGLVAHGRTEVAEFSPLQLLIATLSARSRQGEAYALLVEVGRDPKVREQLHRSLGIGTKDEKIYLARILALSGDETSVEPLERLSRDTDPDVASEALRAAQTLKSRL